MRNYYNAIVNNVTYRGVDPRTFVLISSNGDWEYTVPVDPLELVTSRRLRSVKETPTESEGERAPEA